MWPFKSKRLRNTAAARHYAVLTFRLMNSFSSLESMSESSSQDDEQLEKMNARMERRRSRDSICAPEFQQELRNHEVSEGDTVYLTIKTTGTPEPEVTWYRSGELLKEDTRVKFIKDPESGTYSLLINLAAVEDSGEYRCVASNMGGTVACQAKLLVKGKENSEFVIAGYILGSDQTDSTFPFNTVQHC